MTERVRLLTAALLVGLLGVGFWYATNITRADVGEAGASEIEVAEAAVSAWGLFASTGDIRLVSGWFAADGPQLSQLATEIESIVPGSEYEFELSGAELVRPGLVRGWVVVAGLGGEPQRYHWDIELVQQDGQWKVWTVRTSP